MQQLDDFHKSDNPNCLTDLSAISSFKGIAEKVSSGNHPPSKRADSAALTREELLQAAKELFAERGFASVSTGMIAKAVGVTEGALFHHFKNKKNLFRLVVKRVHQEFQDQIAEGCAETEDVFEALLQRIRLSLCFPSQSASLHRVLQEAPFYLGYDEWRRINADVALATLEPKLRAIAGDNNLPNRQVRPLSLMLLGVINEYCSASVRRDDGVTEDEMVDAIEKMISAWLSKIGQSS